MTEKKYYNAKVVLQLTNDEGKVKNVKEEYLVNAISVTDAEAIITKEFSGATYEWELKAISESRIIAVYEAE